MKGLSGIKYWFSHIREWTQTEVMSLCCSMNALAVNEVVKEFYKMSGSLVCPRRMQHSITDSLPNDLLAEDYYNNYCTMLIILSRCTVMKCFMVCREGVWASEIPRVLWYGINKQKNAIHSPYMHRKHSPWSTEVIYIYPPTIYNKKATSFVFAKIKQL